MKFLNHVFFLAIALVLVACGKEEVPPAPSQTVLRSPAAVAIKIPEDALAEEFWANVTVKTLVWQENGSTTARELPLTGGESESVDFSRGGRLSFEGRSERGSALVFGTVIVDSWNPAQGQPKVILISLRRRG